jgi:hypothetical protein
MTCGVHGIYLKFGSFNGIDPIVPIFFVQTVLNIEEFEQHSSNPQPFSTSVLKEQLEPTLPPDEVLNQIKLGAPITFICKNILMFFWS